MAEQKTPGAPATDEIATVTGGRDITRGYIDHDLYLRPQDRVLLARGGDYRVYEDLYQDDRVMSCHAQRRGAVTSKPIRVTPGGTRRDDRRCADQLREIIASMRWREIAGKMLQATWFGYGVGECMWMRDGAFWALEDVRVRNQRRFVFGPDFRPRLLTQSSWEGEELPDAKFWLLRYGATNDDEPYGRGLAHWCFWNVFFKKNQTKFWLTALEKFGSPTVVGLYRAGAPENEKNALLDAIEAVRSRAGLIAPDGTMLSLLEATRSGSVGFSDFRKAMDRAITTTILSQTMTTEDGSSRSQAEVHLSVRNEVIEEDAHVLLDSFCRQAATWLRDWNFPGAAVPVVEIVMPDDRRLDDLSQRDLRISQMGGWRPTREYIEETYAVAVEEGSGGAPAAPGGAPADMGEREGDPLLAALDAVDAEDWDKLAGPLVRPILDRAKSDPEDLMSDIAALYPELDADAVEAQLTRILFVADAWERLAAQGGDDA